MTKKAGTNLNLLQPDLHDRKEWFSKLSQVQKIRRFLNLGGRLNQRLAMTLFGCMRLAARIYEIRHGEGVEKMDVSVVRQRVPFRKYPEAIYFKTPRR